jgi:hypothetical protein
MAFTFLVHDGGRSDVAIPPRVPPANARLVGTISLYTPVNI